jgi:glycosyltransferase involved in cell wall biosynthesis
MQSILRPVSFSFPPFYLITPWFGTFAGGGGRTFTTLAHMLGSCGVRATVLTTCSKSPYLDWRAASHPEGETEVNGARVIRFPVDQENADLYHAAVSARIKGQSVSAELQEAFFRLGLNSQALIRYVRALPQEAVIIAGHYFQALVPSVINAIPGRIVALPAFHDEPEFYWKPIEQLIGNSRQLLFISEEEKDLAIRTYGQRIGRKVMASPVVGLGVDLPAGIETRLQDSGFIASAKAELRLPSLYLIYVGRIEAGKGLSYLIPWILTLNERLQASGRPPVPLVLVGEGPPDVVPESPFLIKLGFLSDEYKLFAIKQSIALINPSTLESFSYVVMESWLMEAPVLVPRGCAVTAGHVRRCGGGLIFDSEEDFVRQVEVLVQSRLSNAMGVRGSAYVRANFRWSEVMDRVLRAVLK